MKHGLDSGSVISLVSSARERGWGVVLLAPNAMGSFLSGVATAAVKCQWNEGVEEVYGEGSRLHILAHSAGGAQLVECLRDR